MALIELKDVGLLFRVRKLGRISLKEYLVHEKFEPFGGHAGLAAAPDIIRGSPLGADLSLGLCCGRFGGRRRLADADENRKTDDFLPVNSCCCGFMRRVGQAQRRPANNGN